MSLMTGRLTNCEALLATDTLVSQASNGQAIGHCSKTLALPHLRCAFATRGHGAFAAWLLVGIQNRSFAGASFDALLPHLAEVIEQAYAVAFPYIDDDGIDPKLEALFVGWSDAAGKPVGVQFTNVDDADGFACRGAEFTQRDVPPGYFAVPGVQPAALAAVTAKMAKRDPVDNLVEIAKAQRMSALDGSDIGQIGGRLILTTVTKFRIEQRKIFEWPDFDANLTMDTEADHT